MQPFGRLLWYVDKDTHPMCPQTSPGLFLGWRIESGIRYRHVVHVINYDRVKKGGFTAKAIKSIPQKEVHFPTELIFPFAEARKASINQMRPLSGPSDYRLPAGLPWAKEAADAPAAVDAVAPKPTPKPVLASGKAFRITPARRIQFGGTVGCKACDLLDLT